MAKVQDFLKQDFTEINLGLEDGLRIAVKQWGNEHAKTRILAVHGWLDSSATYDKLAPLLISSPKLDVRIVCMDFAGHGDSSHKSKDASYNMGERVVEVANVADALKWDTFVLMGHSMGGAISTLFAAVQPHRVEKLILIDALGTWPGRYDLVTNLSKAIEERKKMSRRQRRVYPSLDEAVARYLGNNPYMKEESARILVKRGTQEVEIFETRQNDEVAPGERGVQRQKGFVFKHDQRLVGLTTMRYKDDDDIEFCRAIECPVLLFLAVNPIREKGYLNKAPYTRWLRREYPRRVAAIKDISVQYIHGSHHLHLDQAEEVFSIVSQFLIDDSSLKKTQKLTFPKPSDIRAKL